MYFHYKKSQNRLLWILVLTGLMFIIVMIRIVQLSGVFNESKSRLGTRKILRGTITDRRGVTLAITEEASTIGINPSEIIDPVLTAKFLAGYLSKSYNQILQKIYIHQSRKYFLLERKIDNYTAELILDLNLPGVYRDYEYKRIYPAGNLASNLIGFVRKDTLEGLAGIEKIYNSILNSPGSLFQGYNLVLSIDSILQYELEKSIRKSFKDSKAEKAIGIMMDIETGEILAMANFPDFNPNFYYKEEAEKKSNWAITYAIEPGSLVKPFFVAMVMNEFPEQISRKVYCNGEFHFGSGSVRCLRKGKVVSHGYVDLEEVLRVSCNVGMIQFLQNLDRSTIYKYLLELGLNQNTGMIPEKWESKGYIPRIDQWVQSTPYYLPIGQGMLVTPVQLIRAFASLVNGGILLKPILVKKIESADKKLKDISKIQAKTTPFHSRTLKILQKYLLKVVEEGTGKSARVPFLKVLGKTGTAQKSNPYGYTDLFTVSFIGAFPYPKPKYVVLIVFDGVKGNYSGGNLAAPVFSHFLSSIKNFLFAQLYSENIHLGQKISSSDAKNIRWFRNKNIVPDFKNHSLKEVISWKKDVLDIYNRNVQNPIILEIFGNGYVTAQYPVAGTPLHKTNRIQVYLSGEDF